MSRNIYNKYVSSRREFVRQFLIKQSVNRRFVVPRSRGKLFLKRIAADKTAFQSKNLISMKTRTTFCIFYCSPCNLWNVCTRELARNIRERATRYTRRKKKRKNVKCKIQKLLTGWLAQFSIMRSDRSRSRYYSANWLCRVTHVTLAAIRLSYHTFGNALV